MGILMGETAPRIRFPMLPRWLGFYHAVSREVTGIARKSSENVLVDSIEDFCLCACRSLCSPARRCLYSQKILLLACLVAVMIATFVRAEEDSSSDDTDSSDLSGAETFYGGWGHGYGGYGRGYGGYGGYYGRGYGGWGYGGGWGGYGGYGGYGRRYGYGGHGWGRRHGGYGYWG
ncbi:unnamed protein product [Bemisia tabaci]|uniref:Neuropeptide-like protein 31 n=1 Tax=Bemisia tabaci TaxID=7038 RepID=A0A9P0AMV6_BEMTA|nr:unnamed protein product [Bemisia tabaci]